MQSELIERMMMHNEDIRVTQIKMNNLKEDLYNNVKELYVMGVEIWKVIDEWDNYEVSTFGNVRNIRIRKIRKPRFRNSYSAINMCKQGTTKTFNIHRLVALTFIPNPKNKKCVDHINNNRIDNNLLNIRWATHQENQMNRGISSLNTSGIKGICLCNNRWVASIRINSKNIYIGTFINKVDAIKARQEKAKELFGEFINDCEL